VRAINLIREKQAFVVIVVVVTMCIMLTGALWVILGLCFEDLIRRYAPAPVVRCFNTVDNFTAFCVGRIGRRLFGLQENARPPTTLTWRWCRYSGRVDWSFNVYGEGSAENGGQLPRTSNKGDPRARGALE
jgi:hypothetical protein